MPGKPHTVSLQFLYPAAPQRTFFLDHFRGIKEELSDIMPENRRG
jgi:hypothetical protein